MNSEQAKETLLMFRPNSSDSTDPEFGEALAQVRNDAELRRWFEEHCARQSLIRDRLRQIPIPRDLKRRILDEVARPRFVIWWRQPLFQSLAVAASILLVVTTALLWPRPDPGKSFAVLENVMVRKVQRMYQMDMATNNLAEIRQYLAGNHAHTNYAIPPTLEKLPADGCAILPWRKKTVSLVCFNLGKRNDLYFFIVNRVDVTDPPQSSQPQFTRIGKLTSASWSRGDKAYILAGRGDEAFIRNYLE